MGSSAVALKRLISVVLLVSVLFVTFHLTRVKKGATDGHKYRDIESKRVGGISNLDDVPFEQLNHKGAVDVFKQVIIRKGEVPALNMFGRAIIKPNGRVPKHTHTNMDEIFYCVEGSGQILVDSKPQNMQPGITIHVA